MFKDAGVDIVDVSAGQTSKAPAGLRADVPDALSDRIRNERGIPTMAAVGNIYEPDHVNSILMAGRADLALAGKGRVTAMSAWPGRILPIPTGRCTERGSLREVNPQGRFIQPEEIAETVLWLCSDGAASVTGQAISLSGGET
jgi:NAD(P)-dependent dehydrogenase (short-subunit alcohol dehydrogenase family)